MVAAGLAGAVAMAAVGIRPVMVSKAPGRGEPASQGRIVLPPVPASIELRGLADGMGGASAGTYSLRIGAQQLAPQPTALPEFTATLPRIKSGDMVSLVLEAPGVKFTSILGSYGRLAALAGPDRILTVDESDALRISPLTTAMEFAVRRKLGALPGTDAQHERAWRAIVDASTYRDADLGSIASILALTAAGELPLPAEFSSGYALVEDRQAVTEFAYEFNNAIVSRDALTSLASTPLSEGDLTTPLAFVGARLDETAPMAEGYAEVLERQSTDWLVHEGDAPEPGHTGGVGPDGRLALSPTVPPAWETYMSCYGGQQAVRRDTLLSREYRLQRRGLGTSVWMAVQEYEATFDPCLMQQPLRYRTVALLSSVPLRGPGAAVRVSGKTTAFAGLRALPYICRASVSTPSGARQTLRVCEFTPHRLDPGGSGQILEIGDDVDTAAQPRSAAQSAPLAWSTGVGFDFALEHDGIRTRYWTVDDDNPAVTGMVYVSEAQVDGLAISKAGYTPMLNGNGPTGVPAFSPVGTWASSPFEIGNDPYLQPDAATVTRMVFLADGKQDQYSWRLAEGPQTRFKVPSTWTFAGARLYTTQVRLRSGGGQYYDCAEAAAAGRTDCYPSRIRVFRPMLALGERIYGVEDVYFNLTSNAVAPPYQFSRTSRPIYLERRSLATDPPTTGMHLQDNR